MKHSTNKDVVIIERESPRNEKSTNVSSTGALKGATTGALIGCRFGPVGLIAGTTIGGVLGYLFDD